MARSIRSFLALTFILMGITFLAGTQPVLRLFEQIGLGDWLRSTAGVFGIISGMLLLIPSRAVIGSSIATAMSLIALLIQAFLAVGSPIITVILAFLSGGSLVQAQLTQPIRTRRHGQAA